MHILSEGGRGERYFWLVGAWKKSLGRISLCDWKLRRVREGPRKMRADSG